MKNILAIHDLSCFGRCALTVVLPTLSAMAHQVTPLPTALLSTHTGGFRDMVITDLSDTMLPSFLHMVESGAKFDAVYSGFLGSASQIDTVKHIIESSKGALICVDPVMGDSGVLYQTYTEKMKTRMSELCHMADVITPNLTEAAFLLDEDYVSTFEMSENEAKAFSNRLINRLKEKYGCPYITITGIEYQKSDGVYVATAVLEKDNFSFISNKHEGTGYPGTGDIFASVLLGHMLNGKRFDECAELASRFIRELVYDTYAAGTPVRDGVLLEKNLRLLMGE